MTVFLGIKLNIILFSFVLNGSLSREVKEKGSETSVCCDLDKEN